MTTAQQTPPTHVTAGGYVIGAPQKYAAAPGARPRQLRTVKKRKVVNWKALFDVEHAKYTRAKRTARRWMIAAFVLGMLALIQITIPNGLI